MMKARTLSEQFKMLTKWKSLIVLTILVAMLVSLTSCVVAPRRRHRTVIVAKPAGGVDVVYVQKAPPKLKVETRSERPGPNAVWIDGHWQWQGGKYVWVSGHWDRNPRGKVWVPGHWEKRPRGWVWVSGHWQ